MAARPTGFCQAPDSRVFRPASAAKAASIEVADMYGPPSDCKGKVQREKVCVNVSGLWVEICSPGLDEIRRVPVLRNPSAV